MLTLTHRLASLDDLPALTALMTRSIEKLQHGFLTSAQIRASHQVMGLDTQLVKDQTYFLIESDGQLVGCGGWSWRATLFGGDDSIVVREPAALDPKADAAKIRAMYVDPDFARQGIGSLIMNLCEDAARHAGFARAEMMATLAGVPLYRACGYTELEPVEATTREGIVVPLIRMGKALMAPLPEPLEPVISFDEFRRVDIRIGRVVDAKPFPEARKPAIKLRIDFGAGIGIKQSSAQITEHYSIEELKGRLVAAVVNFPPRQIGKFMSEVLTLGFPDEQGAVVLFEPDRDVPLGVRLF